MRLDQDPERSQGVAHACVRPQSLAKRLACSQRSVNAEWVKGE